MNTITIQIGNSDDKLKQEQWSTFVEDVDRCIRMSDCDVHFFGFAPAVSPWQNAAWVIVIDDTQELKRELEQIRKMFNQESIAFTTGRTEFV